MNSFIKNIQNFAFRNNLWTKGNKIIIGVSGGPDSVCLLDMLAKISPKYDLRLRIAHINYGLRGSDSQKDEEFVRKLAEKYNLKIDVLRTTQEWTGQSNLENKLREVRYTFFNEILKREKYDLIAVAHNQNDQAETVLMRIIRGSGLQGLRSIKPKNGATIRPLLETSKKDILQYLKENKLKYRIDKTNRGTDFFRNKIRNKLIPYLEKNYNPVISQTLSSIASTVADDYDFIKSESEKAQVKIDYHTKSEKKLTFSVSKINDFHKSLQRQIIRNIISTIKTDLTGIKLGHIDEVLKVIYSQKGKKQTITFGGLKIEKKGDTVIIELT